MKRIPQLGELPATNFGNVTTLTKQLTRRLTERFGPGLSYFRPRRRILPAKKTVTAAIAIFLTGVLWAGVPTSKNTNGATEQWINGRSFSGGEAIRAIYGEACGEPYVGKLAVAGAIRNRGTLRGVYGQTSPLLTQPINARAWAQCARAWRESATRDITHGATHWENTHDFGANYWTRKMQCVGTFGRQQFFK